MSGLLKAVTVVLVVGMACFCNPEEAAAAGDVEGEGDPSGEVPRYYLQLQEYSTGSNVEDSEPVPMLLEYIVEPGDCLSYIADRFGTDVGTLVRLNEITNPHLIHPGEPLEILTVVGSVHDVADGETVSSIAELYGVEEEVIVAANNIDSELLERGERVIIPGGTITRGGQYDAGIGFGWPLQGVLTSGYSWRNGKFHYGIDLAVPLNTPFYASAGGKVTRAGYLGSYGMMVDVDHGWGFLTRYAHAGKVVVSVGQQVTKGQILGYVGLTGNTTGPHLHFELHRYGEKLNPLHFIY